tara:strand:+ start:9952 stop:10500 length:549 start_codon:yes stop_codon:yes gene_type:complete
MSFQVSNTTNSGALSQDPDNKNFLSPVGFKFQIRKLPHVNWFLQSVNIPGINLGEATHPTPFVDTFFPGDMTFDPLNITFKVDEDLKNWAELQEWIFALGTPNNFDEYRRNVNRMGNEAIFSDGTLITLNSYMNANYEIIFKDLFPTSLSDLTFDTTSADIDYLTASATFRYVNYELRKIEG